MKMKTIMKGILFLSLISVCFAGKPYEDRIYEPVVVLGGQIKPVVDKQIPPSEIFVYKYQNGVWEMIPFQIDEKIHRSDPELTQEEGQRERHFYAIANINPAYAFEDTANTAFDGDDELVFMLRDAGDKAPADAWIDNAEARSHNRYELKLTDPLTGESAYVYLFLSSTLTMPAEVAGRYGMQFDPETHTIQSLAYSMGVDMESGLLSDITIKPPYGSGVDIFDTQKLRMNGYLDWGRGVQLYFGRNDANSATEVILVVYPNDVYLAYTENPVVRVIREVRQGLGNNIFGFVYESTEFYLKTKNYPFSGEFEGGTVLDPDSIRDALNDPSIEVAIEVDYLRQSWDFNANASGMKFYNPHNSGIAVDGVPDAVNSTVDVVQGQRLQTWAMLSGNQGTLFNFFNFAQSTWDQVSLYYYDNLNGGQGDNDILVALDSGDMVSYGDNGLTFKNTVHDKPLNMDFSFTSYFLEGNRTLAMAENLKSWITNPVETGCTPEELVSVVGSDGIVSPETFGMLQNFPNPFNMTTQIRFSLDQGGYASLSVYDSAGRKIQTIGQGFYPAGPHKISWEASENGSPLPSGVYLIRLEAPEKMTQKKMVLLK
jgi:hypothetical protein